MRGFVKSRCVCNDGNLIISMFSLLMLTCFMCVMCHTWKSVDKIIFELFPHEACAARGLFI